MTRHEGALKRHVFEFYAELEKRSEVTENGERVYEGSLTKVFYYLGISTSYYSSVLTVLVTSGCIRIVQRGTGRQASLVVLITEPTDENYSEEGLTSPAERATLVASLEKRVAILEAWRVALGGGEMNIAEALRNHELRLSRVEERTSESK